MPVATVPLLLAFTMPLCSDEYILDVTTELLKTNQPFYLVTSSPMSIISETNQKSFADLLSLNLAFPAEKIPTTDTALR